MPAKQIGLESIWIDRRYDKQGGGATPTVENPYIPEFKFLSLKEFASWITKHL
jgi:FMN phosphatase YigB (HAD superfamily)